VPGPAGLEVHAAQVAPGLGHLRIDHQRALEQLDPLVGLGRVRVLADQGGQAAPVEHEGVGIAPEGRGQRGRRRGKLHLRQGPEGLQRRFQRQLRGGVLGPLAHRLDRRLVRGAPLDRHPHLHPPVGQAVERPAHDPPGHRLGGGEDARAAHEAQRAVLAEALGDQRGQSGLQVRQRLGSLGVLERLDDEGLTRRRRLVGRAGDGRRHQEHESDRRGGQPRVLHIGMVTGNT
jgi:hypothetical protein